MERGRCNLDGSQQGEIRIALRHLSKMPGAGNCRVVAGRHSDARCVVSFCNHAIANFVIRSLESSCTVVSDGLACFGAVAKAGCAYEVVKNGSGAAAAWTAGFEWVNTALGNIMPVIVGTYWAIDQKHVPHCLAEFEYRLDRRYDLAAMMPRLLWADVRTHAISVAQAGRDLRFSWKTIIRDIRLRKLDKREIEK